MRILLDENMPESVRHALQDLGHEVDSVVSLRLSGLDRAFVRTVRAIDTPASVKVILIGLRQGPRGEYARAFSEAFQRTDWSTYPSGSEWPMAE